MPAAAIRVSYEDIRDEKNQFKMFIERLITHYVNLIFGAAALWLMHLVGFHPANASAPIDGTFSMELLVAGLIAFSRCQADAISGEARRGSRLPKSFTGLPATRPNR